MERLTKHIIQDPNIQGECPVIEGTRILPEVLYSLFLGGENIYFIAKIYDLDYDQVTDAIVFCIEQEKKILEFRIGSYRINLIKEAW